MKQEEKERAGKMAGFGAGALTGAQIGTALLPIPIVGTFMGALVGGVVGSEVGKSVGTAILNVVTGPDKEGTIIDVEVETPISAATSQPTDLMAQLERLTALRAQGTLSEEEFRAAKARLLNL